MRIVVRFALSVGSAVTLLAGCGGSQSPIGAPSTMAQTSAITSARSHVHRSLPALSYNLLHSFQGNPDGEAPSAGLYDLDGTLYGTTYYGGTHAQGTMYSIGTVGTEKVLHSFGGRSDGSTPTAGLIDVDGTLYGTTVHDFGSGCGGLGCGTVYSVSTDGNVMVLHTFTGGSDGAHPYAGLIYVDGVLFGTTLDGGPTDKGTVYSITTGGSEQVLHTFTGGSDGAHPYATLTYDDGLLYGTTRNGGPSDKGTVYSINTRGNEKVLHSFAGGADGAFPEAGLTYDVHEALDGTLYGATEKGGASDKGTVYGIGRSGIEKVLYSFHGDPDGANPLGTLIEVSGALYGTTWQGGAWHAGTVYDINPNGPVVEEVLHSFDGAGGARPIAGLIYDANVDALYGTTEQGGTFDLGTVYELLLSGSAR